MALHSASPAASPRQRLFSLFSGRARVFGRSAAARAGKSFTIAACMAGLMAIPASAQTTTAPVVLPNTYSTAAGGLTTAQTANAACATGSRYTATDAYGNGCPATQSLIGQDLHGGVVVDGQSNIFINDSNNYTTGTSVQMLRRVDGRTGIISAVLNSNNGLCTTGTTTALGANDNVGDGCAFANSKYSKERGIGADPYGNVFISGYGGNVLRIVCNTVSPLCPVAAGVTQSYSTALKQVGYTYRIAGCVSQGPAANPTNQTSGTAAATAGDGYIASPFWNLPGDVAAWTANGSPAGFTVTAGTNITAEGTNGTCPASATGSTVGGLNGPRAVTADQYGNVFINDGANVRIRIIVGPATFTLPNGTVLTNPWPAIIKLSSTYNGFTAAQMYGRIFPILGGFAASTAGSACANSAYTAKDIYGDSCPWYNTAETSGGNPIGVAVSGSGDLLAVDGSLKLLRVLYSGPTVATSTLTSSSVNPMAYAIYKNNPTLTAVTQGNVYLLAGGGAAGQGNTATLGTGTILANGASRVAVGPNGNIFLGEANAGITSNIGFFDLSTGYIRTIATATAASSTLTVDGSSITAYYCAAGGTGDGQPAYISSGLTSNGCFVGNGSGSGTLGIAVDAQNNLYIADSEPNPNGAAPNNISQSRIRKLLATNLYPTNVNSSITQTLRIHAAAGTTASATAVTAALSNNPSGISIAAPVCGATANGDTTEECTAAVTFAPTAPGLRTSTLTLTPAGTTTANYALGGIATGTAYVIDPNSLGTLTATNSSSTLGALAANAQLKTLALDSAGDVFTIDTANAKFTEVASNGTVTQLGGAPPSSPNQIALDPSGNLYAVGSSSTSVTQLPLTTTGYAPSTTSITVYDPTSTSGATISPRAVTFDAAGNLYVASASSVYQVSYASLSANSPANQQLAFQPSNTLVTGLSSITQVLVDGFGNLFVYDAGASAIYRYDAKTAAQTTAYSGAVSGMSVDTAGTLYYQPTGGTTVASVPFSGATSTTLTGITTPAGVAVANNGNVYSADNGTSPASLKVVTRNALSYSFGTIAFGSSSSSLGLTVSNVGNIPSTGYTATNASEFPLTTGSSNGCGSLPSATNGNTTATVLAAGAACTLTASFTPANGTSTVSSVNSLLPSATTIGAFTLSGTESGATAPTTTTAITGPSSATYVASGTEATFTVTVTPSNSGNLATGVVNVSIDGGATTQYTLNSSNQASVPVSGLGVGSHTILATFPSQSISSQSYGQSNSSPATSFSITQASTTVSWTPGTLTQQFSAPIGTAVLNASATSSGNSVPGVFVYTAGGQEVHAASYLARGTYVLGVTFYPTDSTDYATSTGSVSGYMVTQATTSAGIGATQSVVGLTGSGANYIFTPNASIPSVNAIQNAIQSLSSTTGGNVYILPGTYTGAFTVNAPNVSLRGLGGDPTAITLTRSFGAFSPAASCSGSPGNCYAGEYTALFQNNYGATGTNAFTGDEGSSTLVVARSAIAAYASGATLTPTGFYADNLTLQNTYNFDATSTTTYTVSGTCTANAGAAKTYAQAYNDNTQCASQALAIWITADQALLNNVYFRSGQDTIYAGAVSGGSGFAARQLYFRGKVEGNIDYIFGDAAALFDRTSIYTTYHRSQTGNETIGAQNKAAQTGSAGDYLSGYVFNSNVFTTQSSGMTGMYFARPYGKYSTQVFLNSYIDQVNASGYEEFSGATNLPTSTYVEYNNSTYTDPATGSADLNGVIYNGTGGSTGSGVTSTRETASSNPGTIMTASGGFQTNYPTLANTTLANFEAQQYYPLAFLGKTVASNPYNGGVTNWDPTAALAAKANAFVNGGVTSAAYGSSVTILMRPQTPGLGAITNGSYTIPTGTYTLSDGATQLATGNLDASGEAYFTTANLTTGAHSLTWTYSGDANFAGSASSTFNLTISAGPTTTTLTPSTQTITYGGTVSLTATVAQSGGSAAVTGSVNLYIDGSSTAAQTVPVSSGSASFTVANLTAGNHTFIATYSGDGNYGMSTSASVSATVNKAVITVTGTGVNRLFNQPNSISHTTTGYQNGDNASTVFTSGPSQTTTATRDSVVGTYTVTPTGTLTAFGSANYTLNLVNGSFNITGGDPQNILFAPLPNFPSGGTYQLTARTTSGLPVAYSVTTGNASVSGTALTVSGTGTVTIQASTPADPTGDYAAATPVSRSFTAQ